MTELFSIGETAKLNNVSIKSLRHYDEIGLLKPKVIDPVTGYRYYAYSQFSFIDKIKRYKNIGVSLKDLKEVFQSHNLAMLEKLLQEQKRTLEEEFAKLEARKQDIAWLVDFFEYSKGMTVSNEISIKEQAECHVICAPCDGDDSMYAMDLELRRIAATAQLRDCQVMNPYGYLLDFDRLMENKMYPLASTVCVLGALPEQSPYIMKIPKGRYLCCKANILSQKWDISPMIAYCREHGLNPKLCIANEYLSSLNDPTNSPYEIMLLLPED